VLAYLQKPTASRPRHGLALLLDDTGDEPDGDRPAPARFRPQALLTAALLLTAVLVGLTTAALS